MYYNIRELVIIHSSLGLKATLKNWILTILISIIVTYGSEK